ncbi:MAG: DNA gyrase inhibitor YacG [Bdellovibrionales bacterium]|nr:DNA gyrase inhibitor YacG [Bdellovibrionales bacterium]
MNKKIIVQCPQCATSFSYYESEYRPFCCEKCQQIDLGHWFKESYVVPVKEQDPEKAQVESDNSENNVDTDEENNESEYH